MKQKTDLPFSQLSTTLTRIVEKHSLIVAYNPSKPQTGTIFKILERGSSVTFPCSLTCDSADRLDCELRAVGEAIAHCKGAKAVPPRSSKQPPPPQPDDKFEQVSLSRGLNVHLTVE